MLFEVDDKEDRVYVSVDLAVRRRYFILGERLSIDIVPP